MPELNILGAKEENRYYPYQQAFRVTRKSFWQAGQDSFTQPPSQNPDMFQALTNVEPVLQGNLQRRRGYTLFSNTAPTIPFKEGYAYRNEINFTRRLVWTSASTVVATDEVGNITSNPLFTPSMTATAVRMVLSRSYGYFANGVRSDYVKWDGTPGAGNLTNWGIDIGGSPASTAGPFNPGTVSQRLYFAGDVAWAPGTSLPSSVTIPGTPSFGRSKALQGQNYGFAVSPATKAITGVTVNITGSQTQTGSEAISVQLLKAGTLTGTLKGVALPSSTGTITLGSSTDTWGTSLVGTDVNDPTFGVSIIAGVGTVSTTFTITAITVTLNVSGGSLSLSFSGTGITLLSGRVYTVVFQNSIAGTTSALYPFSASTGPLVNSGVDISGIPVSTDPQVDTKLILATADGGDETTLYLVAQILNAATTYHDSMPDSQLLIQPIYQETDQNGFLHGVANNNIPPLITFPVKHQGRIFGIGTIQTSGPAQAALCFSKNLDDVTTSTGTITGKWEEAWPATYSLDISENAETGTGLLSDGQTLYIATDTSIRRLVGDSPSNFQKPEVIFNETGVINQEVWKIVFTEGQPVGSMWLTPDRRVMFSDFNSYQDIGTPIQDVLNTVNITVAQSVSHACFVSKGPSEYFMLYIPTGSNTFADTICVYNLRSKKWCIWKPSDIVTASLFNINATGVPQWLFATQVGPLYFWDETTRTDRALGAALQYPVPITTSWLDFGDEGLTKAFNKIIVTTSDPGLTVAVQGAIRDSDLDTGGILVLPPTPLQAEIFGELFVPDMVSLTGKYKWYQITFTSPASTIVDVLDGLDFEIAPSMRM